MKTLSEDEKIIRTALRVYQMELAREAHQLDARPDSRAWAQAMHDRVCEVISRQYS